MPQHTSSQYEGLFRGLGATCREPVCNKRNTSTKLLHDATHFAVGCDKWDDGGRGSSSAHASYIDHQVFYATIDAPDKNASTVELRQTHTDPAAHYRTEQRDRYLPYCGVRPREPAYRAEAGVHLGDDCPELVTQMQSSHGRLCL